MIAALLLAALIGPLSPPHPSQNRGLKVDAALLASGAVLDLASTEYVLRNCQSCREGNPMGSRWASRMAVRAAGVVVGTFVCHRLRQTHHPRAARVLGLLGLSGGIAASASNLAK